MILLLLILIGIFIIILLKLGKKESFQSEYSLLKDIGDLDGKLVKHNNNKTFGNSLKYNGHLYQQYKQRRAIGQQSLDE